MYIGRFAPSPTGPMHIGSLYTAVASFLDAKANNGLWLLRIEDLDPPREDPQSIQSIIGSLTTHGLLWDGDVLYQSQRLAAYASAIQRLQEQKLAYYCECSRQQLKNHPDLYPGFCRNKSIAPTAPCAIRLIAQPPAAVFTDRLLGQQKTPEIAEGLYNDFVIYRKDKLFAYQLAVTVDDIYQGVTHIVRGSDILESTFKQGYLYRYFQHNIPEYLHLPVIMAGNGQKLSKQNLAPAIDNNMPCANLLSVLSLLRQTLPPPVLQKTPQLILKWAIAHWNIANISKTLNISP